MRNDQLDVLYDRWFASKNSVAEEMLRNEGVVSGVIPTAKIRCLFESASRHVSVQSDDFYQILRKAYEENPSANHVLDFLFHDLKMLRVGLFTFGERFLGDRSMGYVRISRSDWGYLTASIAQRIALEENQLGPLLKRDQKVGCQG